MAYMLLSGVVDAAAKLASFVRNLHVGASSSSSTHDVPEKIQEGAERLRRMVKRIRALLDDTEEREIRDKHVRLWLRELEGVAYDAEDVLEELQYEAQSLQIEGHLEAARTTTQEMGNTALQGITVSRNIVTFLQNVEQRIAEINLSFQEISEDRVALELKESDGQRRVKSEIPVREPTSSLIMEESQIVGRMGDLKIVKEFLLSNVETNGSAKIPIMAIVGMGGLGKTTLAQLAYNDVEIRSKFDLRAWICVSEDFDLIKLTRDMVESFTGDGCLVSALDPLHIKLTEELAGKRYLLVLDDVWELGLERSWDSLIRPLHQKDRTMGSKVIITTRNVEVSKIAGAAVTHHLTCLREEECQRVFCHRAFEGRDPATLHDLLVMAKEISRKCGGVPLVAKILGSQLRWVDDVHKWEDIVGSDIWDIDGVGIMPILKLSYDFLPTHLKKCFKFCSLLPKDHRFDKNWLVQMWMAHGYIQAKGRSRPMEDIGMDYLHELLWRSFFQWSKCTSFWGSGNEVFQMHDLIHDLARYVSGDEYCSLEDGKPSSNTQGNVRYFLVVSNEIQMDVVKHIYRRPRKLRSFVLIRSSWEMANTVTALDDVLSVTKYLRVLDLSNSTIDYLPCSIFCLKLLHYLGLPSCLARFYGSRLPGSLSKLLNLRHLVYENDVVYTVGIGKLTNLQTMAGFHCSPENGHAKLEELKDINDIQTLCISNIGKFVSVEQAKKACLKKKEHLRELQLKWDDCGSPFDDELLESLKPNPTLQRLEVGHFTGGRFPSWLGDSSFSKLTSVKLNQCGNVSSLPCLGKLPLLNFLCIRVGEPGGEVKHIGREFFSGGFPRLETLQFESIFELESWRGVEDGECPRLQKLMLDDCRYPESFSVINLPALQDVYILTCTEYTPGTSLLLENLPSLQNVEIRSTKTANYISGLFDAGLLKTLKVQDVKHIPFALQEGVFSHLCQLKVSCCEDLSSFRWHNLKTQLSALETLSIQWCPRLRFSDEDLLPASLRELRIHGCPLLTDWCQRHQVQLLHMPTVDVEGLDTRQLRLRNVVGVQAAVDIRLSATEHIWMLELEWDDVDASLGRSSADVDPKDVLDNLRPHSNLERLVIQGYAGLSFPTWLGDSLLSKLASISLIQCSRCTLLPPLGRLPHLQDLYISGAHSLERVGTEFFGGGCNSGVGHTCGFRHLRSLEFHDMPIWREWQGAEDCDLPSLKKLTIKHCPRLGNLPYLAHLKVLEVEASEQLMFHDALSTQLPSLQMLQISDLPGLRLLPTLPKYLVQLLLKGLPAVTNLQNIVPATVRDLTLEGCNEAATVAALPCLTNLTSLRISQLPQLTQPLPLHNLVALQVLEISSCPKLESLDCFYFSPLSACHTEGLQALESLRCLWLTDCPKLCFSANERPPSTVRYFALARCPQLVAWCDRDLSRLSHIRDIWVDKIQVSAVSEQSIRSQIEAAETHEDPFRRKKDTHNRKIEDTGIGEDTEIIEIKTCLS